MSGSTELLVLRLALIAVVFLAAVAITLSLRASLLPRPAPRPTQAAPRGWRVVIEAPGETGLRQGAPYPLAGKIVIGREPSSGIVLADPSVSSRHASIEATRGGWKLRDLGSTNGTSVNGRAVGPEGSLLRGGERVGLGAVVVRVLPPGS